MQVLDATDRDVDQIVALFKQYNFALKERKWLEWKYFRNPYGQAHSYKIVAEDRIVGTTSLLPRSFYFRGRKLTCLQSVDSLLGNEVRGQGLFRKMIESVAARTPERSGDDYFFLGFVSLPASVRALAGAGWHRLADFRLYTRFINIEPALQSLGMGVVSRKAAQAWKWMNDRLPGHSDKDIEVMEVGEFGKGMNDLFSNERVYGDRSDAFFDWRVKENPMAEIKRFALKEAEGIAGYFVCRAEGRSLEIIDCKFKMQHPRYLRSFVRYVSETDGADKIDCRILPHGECGKLFAQCGFLRRGRAGSVFVHHAAEAALPLDECHWQLSLIDSDW